MILIVIRKKAHEESIQENAILKYASEDCSDLTPSYKHAVGWAYAAQ